MVDDWLLAYQRAEHGIKSARLELLKARSGLGNVSRFVRGGDIDLTELDEVIEQLDGLLGRLVLVDSRDGQ